MEIPIKTICCIGAGYVGGPTMTMMASKCPNYNFNVVDINEERIASWNNEDLSKLPVFEPGLKELIAKTRNKNLFFSTNIKEAIESADIIFISVNTPTKTKGLGAGKSSDLKWVEASAREVARYSKGYTIVVEKSTLPVRTAEVIENILNSAETNSKREEISFDVLSNPEFLAEGTAIKDLENPDRVLIGGDNKNAMIALSNIYKAWVPEEKILFTNIWSSELAKLTSNAFLAQRISSINSISAICEVTGADVREVSRAIGKDTRIGSKFLDSGPGFGGSCFKKDILNLVYICNYYGLNAVADYWEKVITINKWQQNRIVSIVVNKLYGTISGKKIAILGFAFKANTNDTRESPAIRICKGLLEEGCNLSIYDPKVSVDQIDKDLECPPLIKLNDSNKLKRWELANSVIDSATDSHAIVIVTEWDEFQDLNWELISQKMRSPSWLFDTRSICNIEEAKLYGINIWRIGAAENIFY